MSKVEVVFAVCFVVPSHSWDYPEWKRLSRDERCVLVSKSYVSGSENSEAHGLELERLYDMYSKGVYSFVNYDNRNKMLAVFEESGENPLGFGRGTGMLFDTRMRVSSRRQYNAVIEVLKSRSYGLLSRTMRVYFVNMTTGVAYDYDADFVKTVCS